MDPHSPRTPQKKEPTVHNIESTGHLRLSTVLDYLQFTIYACFSATQKNLPPTLSSERLIVHFHLLFFGVQKKKTSLLNNPPLLRHVYSPPPFLEQHNSVVWWLYLPFKDRSERRLVWRFHQSSRECGWFHNCGSAV